MIALAYPWGFVTLIGLLILSGIGVALLIYAWPDSPPGRCDSPQLHADLEVSLPPGRQGAPTPPATTARENAVAAREAPHPRWRNANDKAVQ